MATYTGASGVDILTGDSADDFLYGLAGDDSLYGLGGADLLDGGTGADTIVGGTGDDLFVYGHGDDADTVTDFTAGSATDDVIDLSGVASATVFQDVLDAATDDGTDTTIDFGSGDTIALLGVVESELHADDFSFA